MSGTPEGFQEVGPKLVGAHDGVERIGGTPKKS